MWWGTTSNVMKDRQIVLEFHCKTLSILRKMTSNVENAMNVNFTIKLTRGPRNGENYSDLFQKEGNMQHSNFSIPIVVLHCIISQMLWSQPCNGDTEASKNLI
jgi:hypothetical protein